MIRAATRQLPWVSAAILPLLAGCGPSLPATYPVAGKLIYPDGSPVPGASIEFQTDIDGKAYNARGRVGTDGTFRLSTFEADDGIVAGNHTAAVVPLPNGADSTVAVDCPIPDHYFSYETSDIKATVSPETKELVLTIDRKKRK